ncbi:zinc-binding dehydrogenase [Amycolatopsis ultiminotia]|uniref:Zinc-binding dehydrogenase n=1 Tax=Amycolatopsis ultiminotia TaxID=543629 RepID=A0ABP6XGB1_9PSEU
MRALLADRGTPAGIRLGTVADPDPAPSEALVRTVALSLNFGETELLADSADGAVPGWEAAGIVERQAADGSGPAAGTPVVLVTAGGGSWAELVAVPTAGVLAEVPAGADLGAMSTVPVAAASALRALHRTGPLLGRRILVTGATGGVGRYAVQLARLGGAHVLASTGSPDVHGESLVRLGAHEVVAGPGAFEGEVHGVLDTVGGSQLVAAFDRLAAHGVLVSVGHASGEPDRFPQGALIGIPGRHDRSIVTFFLGDESGIGPDLAWLVRQVATGVLDPQISWRGSWESAAEALVALRERRLHGKAVLEVR